MKSVLTKKQLDGWSKAFGTKIPSVSEDEESRVIFYPHADTNFIDPKKKSTFKKKGKMTCTIPPKLRTEMEADPFYKKCCITGRKDEKIEWHHNLIFAKKRVNEKFCILPLLKSVHRDIIKHKEKVDWIMWNRATPEQIQKYSKAVNYQFELERLNKIYGKYHD